MLNFKNFKEDPFTETISLLFLLMPFALITGQALPDIILSLISLFFLVFSILNKRWDDYQNYFIFGFFLFLIYGIVRSLLSEFPWYSLSESGSLFYFRYLFFILGVNYILTVNPKLISKFINILLLCILLTSLDGIFQFIFEKNLIGIEPSEKNRMSSFFGKEAILGRYLTYLLSIFLFLYLSMNLKKYQKIIFTFLIPIVLGVVFLSGDRAPLLKLFMILASFIFFLKINRSWYFMSMILTLIISIIVLTNSSTVKSRLIDDSLGLIKQNQFFNAPYGRDYEDIYVTSIRIGNLNPFFGKGPNAYKPYCSSGKIQALTSNCSHPHNFYLQLYSEQGIIGLSFLIILYSYLIKIIFNNLFVKFKKNTKNEEPFSKIGVVISLAIFLFPFIPNMNIYNNWNNIFIFILIAFFFNFYKDQLNFKKNGK